MGVVTLDLSPVSFLVPVAVAVGLAIAYVAWRGERQRREALDRLAADRGWTYAGRDDSLVRRFRRDFALFRAGNGGRHCRNVLHASTPGGLPCLLFDYSYEVRSTSGPNNTTSKRTVRHAVAAVELPAPLPELRLAPESFLTRVASSIGFGGIDLESDEFNRRFRVRASDRAHAFDVLHPRTIEFLLAQRLDSWELVGSQLLVTTGGRWDLADYDRVVAKLQRFVDLVPDYVWRKHGGQAPR